MGSCALGAGYVLIDWSSASRFLTKPSALALDDDTDPQDFSAVPLLLSHSRFLISHLDEVFTGNGFSVFAIPGNGAAHAADFPETTPSEALSCRGSSDKEKRGRPEKRQPCVAIMTEPVLAGLGRGTTTANWESGAITEGELILAIDGKTEVPLTEGRDGAYKLKQLGPGSPLLFVCTRRRGMAECSRPKRRSASGLTETDAGWKLPFLSDRHEKHAPPPCPPAFAFFAPFAFFSGAARCQPSPGFRPSPHPPRPLALTVSMRLTTMLPPGGDTANNAPRPPWPY